MSEKLRLFIEPSSIKDSTCTITGEDLHYIKDVMRAVSGDHVELRDGSNKLYAATIKDVSERMMTLSITATRTLDTELPIPITLAQALPKADKMELIVQKCIELGVHDIIPVQTERCIVKVAKDKEKAKLERWNKIAKAAALQSGRGIVPEVKHVHSWEKLVETFPSYDIILLPWELEEGISLKTLGLESDHNYRRFLIIIGPEGGFTPQEIALARSHGAKTITLGKRILRTETAGMALLAMLNYVFES